MGDSRFARCLQGGGVAVVAGLAGGTVSIVNSQIYSNLATYVRAHSSSKVPIIAPMGKSQLLVVCREPGFTSMLGAPSIGARS